MRKNTPSKIERQSPITEIRVHLVANDLVARGVKPTIRKIQAQIGGSNSTIRRWLYTWNHPSPPNISEELQQRGIDLVHKVWMELSQEMAEAIATRDTHIAKLLAERTALETEVAELRAQLGQQSAHTTSSNS